MVERRIVHEVSKTGNLYYLWSASIGAINRFADVLGAGLQAIALALSTPQDNSTEVQKHIDSATARISVQESSLREAIEKQKGL